jgi:molybdate transport system permease protein
MAEALLLSLRLGILSAALCLALALPLAFLFEGRRGPIALALEALISLPMVLPPVVLGFYLLLLLSRDGPVGAFFEGSLGLRLAFSFPGILIATVVSSLPLMYQALRNGLAGLDPRIWEASASLGKGRLETYLRVALPAMPQALASGLLLCAAHAMGEFGAIVMVGGSVAGETKTASVAIFEAVEALDYEAAGWASFVLAGASYALVLAIRLLGKDGRPRRWK